MFQWALDTLDPSAKDVKERKTKAEQIMNRMGKKDVALSSYESASFILYQFARH